MDDKKEKTIKQAIVKIILSSLTIVGFGAMFVVCAIAYSHHNRRALDVVQYIVLFFIVGVVWFIGGIYDLVVAVKNKSKNAKNNHIEKNPQVDATQLSDSQNKDNPATNLNESITPKDQQDNEKKDGE